MSTPPLPPRAPSNSRPLSSASNVQNSTANHGKTTLETLLQMGFSKERSLKALAATGTPSRAHGAAQIAADWLMAHVQDPTIDEICPRHFHIHLCPAQGSPLSKSLQTFWDASVSQIGWNGAHNLYPHITLVAGLAVPDEKVEQFVNIVQRTCHQKFGADLATLSEMSFEKYVSPNFLGFFVGKNEEILLRSLVQALAEEVRTELGLSIDAKINHDTKSSFHITLAYQFLQKHYAGLQDLAASVDIGAKADWELRVYSCEMRMAMPDVNAFKVDHAHRSRDNEELELILGDYIYITEDAWEASNEGWISGTSWLTGKAGYLPRNYVIPTAENNTWTVHLALPVDGRETSLPPAAAGASEMSSATSLERLKELANAVTSSTWTLNSVSATAKDEHQQLDDTVSISSSATVINNTGRSKHHQPPRGPRKIFVVRHGERVDFTFGTNWMLMNFDKEGKYRRMDMNMPKTVPARKLGREGFVRDCPLTEIGHMQAEITGRNLRDAGIQISHVYASPSLRCVQTASSILKGLGSQYLKIHIEPGLFEWLAWYQDSMPDWMTAMELAEAGYNIEVGYKPYISAEELQDAQANLGTEGCEAYYTRNFFVTQCVLASTEAEGGDILFVGHAATLDACARQLTGQDPRPLPDMMTMVRKVAYCGVAMLEEDEVAPGSVASDRNKGGGGAKRKWRLKEPPVFPLTHSSNSRFDVRELMD